jgi:hypothetical protein
MEHPRPWLRYVDASDLDNSAIKFDDMPVDSPSGEKLGKVDGVIVDVSEGRPYYIVVDAGGWFKSKYFLLPIGHVAMSTAQDRLTADLGRDRVERYPGFDRGEFEKLSDDELDRMAGQIADACCPPASATTGTPGAPVPRSAASPAGARGWVSSSHYAAPGWWRSEYYVVDTTSPSRAEREAARRSSTPASQANTFERERVVAQGDDVSPYPGGRAQPGDVLGLETGGEETHVGETSKDENDRRRDAEKDAEKRRGD